MSFEYKKNYMSSNEIKQNARKRTCSLANYEHYFLIIFVSCSEFNGKLEKNQKLEKQIYLIEDAKFSYQENKENEFYSILFSAIAELVRGKTLKTVSEMNLGKDIVNFLLKDNKSNDIGMSIDFFPEKFVGSCVNPLKTKLGIKDL